MNYSIKTTLLKVLKYFVAFLLPYLVDQFVVAYPEIAQLTVGAILLGIVNYIKVRFTPVGAKKSWTRFIP